MLEVCVDSLESARNALTGGADRLEVCSSLNVGGLTPSVGLLKAIKNEFPKAVLFVMLRCRPGNFRYSEDELTTMLYDLQTLKCHGADGFVFGALNADRLVDRPTCDRVVAAAQPLPVTFHRAFDLCNDPLEALQSIIDLKFSRILTSGQRSSAVDPQAIKLIQLLISTSKKRIIIMAGAGIDHKNIRDLLNNDITEVHGSFKHLKISEKAESDVSIGLKDDDDIYITDEEFVRMTVDKLKKNT